MQGQRSQRLQGIGTEALVPCSEPLLQHVGGLKV